MKDREKVIEGLGLIREFLGEGLPGQREVFETYINILKDAENLLKDLEAKPMTEHKDGWHCPSCGLKIVGKTASGYPCDEYDLPDDSIVNFCPRCGQEVTWE